MVPSKELSKSKFVSLVKSLQSSARNYIGEASRCSKKNKRQMITLLKQSESLTKSTINLAQESFVEPSPGCVGATTCTLTVSLVNVKKTLEKNIKKIRDLTKKGKQVVATCRKPITGTAKGSKDILTEATQSIKGLPNHCKISCKE
jgi:accessory colonization factor AcfC